MEQYLDYKALTLRDYIRIIFRRKGVMGLVFVVATVALLIGLALWTPTYQASVKMLIAAEKQVEAPYYQQAFGSRTSDATMTQSEIVRSNPVIERTVWALALYDRPKDYEKQFCTFLKAPVVDALIWITDFINRLLNPDFAKMTAEQKSSYNFRSAVESLKENILVEPVPSTNVFLISVFDYSSIGAATIANSLSRSYAMFDLEQQLADLRLKYGEHHQAVLQLKDHLEKMSQTLNGQPLPVVDAIGPASVKIVQQAQVPMDPVYSHVVIFFIGIGVNLLLSLIVAFILEYADQTFKSPADIEKSLGLPVLGSIPRRRRKLRHQVLARDMPDESSYVFCYRKLADQVFLLSKNRQIKSFLFVASIGEEEGDVVAANLGIYFAKTMGHSVLLIDANLRTPSLHRILGVSDVPGLADILEGHATWEKCVQDVDSRFAMLTAGRATLNPLTIVDSVNMTMLLTQAKAKYDFIFIYGAPMRDFKDVSLLAPHVEAVILVVGEGKTRRQVTEGALASLRPAQKNILGTVLTHRTFSIPKGIYEKV